MPEDVLARLAELPPAAAALAALAGEPGVHIVGGAVRDVLLGRRPTEVDFVVEGDAPAVARRAARKLDGEVLVHERFATATVRAEAVTFDLASTRRERYRRPGALPEVVLGARLEEDLERRDFTVNAVAVALADGRMTAHPAALADLAARVLRVLQPRSFADDPTRLLRLCRSGARLGLAVEPRTTRLAREAIDAGALRAVSGKRIGGELRLLLGEPQPSALEDLERWGLGAAVHPAFRVERAIMLRARELSPADARTDLLSLACCLLGADAGELADRLDELGFASRDRRRLLDVTRRGPELAQALAREAHAPASRLWQLLHEQAPETVALAGALSGDSAAAAARRWLEELRHARAAISGRDLTTAGLSGRAVGVGLAAARAAALDGDATSRDEQLAVALDAAAGKEAGCRPST